MKVLRCCLLFILVAFLTAGWVYAADPYCIECHGAKDPVDYILDSPPLDLLRVLPSIDLGYATNVTSSWLTLYPYLVDYETLRGIKYHDPAMNPQQGHITHLTGNKGPHINYGAYGDGCLTCHDKTSLDAGDPVPALTPGACDACHSPGGAFDGTAMATAANWQDGVYEADGTTLRAGNEQWCASCHDGEMFGDPAYSKPVEPAVVISILIDNTDPEASGGWPTSSWCTAYNGINYAYHTAGAGTDTFTWDISARGGYTAGTYEVFAYWCADPSRAPDATYTVYHDAGSTQVVKDQQSNGGAWMSLGVFDFDGAGDYVELVESASGYVIADAIKLTPPSDDIIVDNPDGTAVGTWGTSSWFSERIGSDYRYHTAGAGTDTFTWTPTITSAGTYQVLAYWCDNPGRAPDATYTIYHDGGITSVSRDQRSPGEWVSLGAYNFDGVGTEKVEVVQSENGLVIADAIRWTTDLSVGGVYAPNVIGDDLQTYGFYVTGHAANSNTQCTDCHDASKAHIDHTHRTSADGNYQAGYRLAKAMVVPRPDRSDMYAYLDDFELCGNCHNLYEVLGQNSGDVSHTNFWNDDSTPRNGHNRHIGFTGVHADSDWDGVVDSTGTCISCHDVHGPPNQAMIRHGELISTYGTTDKVPGLNFCYLTSLSPEVCDPDAALQDSVGSKIAPNGNKVELNGVCNACHSSRKVERAPYLGPKVLTTKADPDPCPPDGATNVVLTAFVLDHDNDVTSVTIDLTNIGGGSGTTMYDDGSNGGDVTADDNVYTITTTIPGSVADGVKSLFVEADDADGPTGTNYLVMTVRNPAVVDNTDAGASYTGTWGTSSWYPGYIGTNYAYHTTGAGTETFTWTPTITTTGSYEVWARWTNSGANPDTSRATGATYTVYHDAGSTQVVKDQQYDGGVWVSLGIFNFDGAGTEKVELVQSASGIVIADAIWWELQ